MILYGIIVKRKFGIDSDEVIIYIEVDGIEIDVDLFFEIEVGSIFICVVGDEIWVLVYGIVIIIVFIVVLILMIVYFNRISICSLDL